MEKKIIDYQNRNTEITLEFDRIRLEIKNHACTEWAKEKIDQMVPFLSESEVDSAQRETEEARQLIEKCGNPPMTAMESFKELLDIAEKGGCLTAEQLEHIADILTSVKRLKDYLKRGMQYEIALAYFEENLDSMEDLRDELHQKIRGGRVDDYATRQLKSLREAIEKTRSKMQEKADSVLRSGKKYMSDSFSTTKNGHLCVPVKKEYKLQVPGSVIEQSSTGSTLFIEPAAVTSYYQQLIELEVAEENEERTILYSLSAEFAENEEAVLSNIHTVSKLDFLFAKALYAMDCNGIRPTIHTGHSIRLKQAVHPLMDRNQHVPLDFEIGTGINGIIITGPNTGGKTVAIKTVALTCMMAQCGLQVACKEADICMNSCILCDIGDGQDISQNLSTFSAHIRNVLEILRCMDRESLVIMDELGSGTDPTEGMGIAIAVLEELRKSGALYLVTTHYPEIKIYAKETEGVINARMTFDQETLQPLYQMVIGEAGQSCAFAIAKRLGMPGNMLKEAIKAAYGVEKNERIEIPEYENVLDSLKIDDKECLKKEKGKKVQKKKNYHNPDLSEKYHLGDSVMIFPDKKIGIVCEPVNEKGILRVQMPNKKIYINHKRVKLHVAADSLYPPDYDFSIIFDSVENRKASHQMDRKYVENLEIHRDE